MSKRLTCSGFTLLELVVVLAILAITTGLAVRALDRGEDQRRFENAQRGFEELSEAVLGSPDDRNIDGTRTISGFVADMGRLPRAMPQASPTGGVFTLGELWSNPGALYDIRQATAGNVVPSGNADNEVWVPGGWRGPYLRLPMGADTLLDAWGNPMISPGLTEYARLGSTLETPITEEGQEIRVIRHFGANGRAQDPDAAPESGYDRDETLEFTDNQFHAGLTVQIEVLAGNAPVLLSPTDKITVRVFGPSPSDPGKIAVTGKTVTVPTDPDVVPEPNPVTLQIPVDEGMTIGPRIVRAYFDDVDNSSPTAYRKSAIKQVTLRPGMNFLQLTIDR